MLASKAGAPELEVAVSLAPAVGEERGVGRVAGPLRIAAGRCKSGLTFVCGWGGV